ncbi:hypothetical protein FP744_10006551 [Trichoderma asperellum]
MSQQLNDDSIIIAPPPWILKADVYSAVFWISASQAENFPFDIAYSPLELSSQFADLGISRPVGGVGTIQIIRYKETPVGPYDELVIVPGKFEWIKKGSNDEYKSGYAYKATRLYVSQKHTCFNGRANWNIPKHLARFDWEAMPDKSLTVRVYPHDTSGDETEAMASSTPFFQATMKPMPFIPSFPFSSSWLSFLGIDLECVHPPLPKGRGSQGELPGTDSWCAFTPVFSGKASSLMTIDISQCHEDDKIVAQRNKSFWPGVGRWRVGLMAENANLVINTREI